MNEYVTLCVRKGDRLKIHDRSGFDAALLRFGEGEEFELELRTLERKRTRAQEKFFHGPVLKAFEPLGYRKAEAKEMLCLRFIPQEIHLLDGTVVVVPGRTSTLNVRDYNDLIEQSIQLAAENGQVVLDGAEWRARRAHELRKTA
jgi:hypothetical protein